MAHRRSSLKKIRVDKRRRERNLGVISSLRTEEKKANNLVIEKKSAEALKYASTYYSALDKAVKRGILHKNNASRQKSRFALRLNALKASK